MAKRTKQHLRTSRVDSGRNAIRTARNYRVSSHPDEMSYTAIKRFRENTLGVSQKLFASLLNVAVQTVHAWEQNRCKPSGSVLRLLQMAQENPDQLEDLIEAARHD
ncbi:hypothetical protein LCGC14_2139300 [marine sediment metagenome]|uniref:HTH cro/C1-type domain-containing protein n=1 Tax=marine sediment metagenome TaxID=412755 RepID=A0A0F9GBZ1_9ZZZZ